MTNADYVIAYSDYPYRDEPSRMAGFVGTFRELLEHLNGVTDENRLELFRDADGNLLEIRDMADSQMLDLFNEANGDGQPYAMVWSVKEGKQVLG